MAVRQWIPNDQEALDTELAFQVDALFVNRQEHLPDSYDGQRMGKLILRRIDNLLDHYPHGSPRDHLVPSAHDGDKGLELPYNVVVGED